MPSPNRAAAMPIWPTYIAALFTILTVFAQANFLVQNVPTKRNLATSASTARWMCRLSNPENVNDVVSVIIEGQHRYLSFGSDIDEEWQSRVHCTNTACAIQTSLTPVDDAEKCSPCPCETGNALLQDDMYYNGDIFKEIEPLCNAASHEHPVDILMVGLGGGAMHRHVLERCPQGTRVRSIEYDQRIVDLAQRYFGLKLVEGTSEVHVGDALEVTRKLQAMVRPDEDSALIEATKGTLMGNAGWDAVVVDCFNDDEIPDSCKSTEFLHAVKSILKPSGALIHHVYNSWPGDPSQAKEFREITNNYKAVFKQNTVIKALPKDESEIESLIIARL